MKKILSLILSLAMLLTVFAMPVSAEEHWAQSAAETLMEKNIVSGYSDGSLKLDNNITRAEFVKIINKIMGYTEKAETQFPDVSSDKWYFDEMLIAKGAGYISGDDNGNSNPEANITRAEASVILARILKLDTSKNEADLKDLKDIPDWAIGSIAALCEKGIIKGYEDGTFRYNNNLTRGESFSVVVKVMPTDEESDKQEETSADPDVQSKEENPFATDSTIPSGGSVSVNVKPSSGGGGGGGGSSSSTRKVASVPKLKYNKDISLYTLAWSKSTGAEDYNIKISLEGEEDFIIKNYSDNSIDLFSYFSRISADRTNAEETFEVTVMANGKDGYKNSAYASSVSIDATFESIATPVLFEKNAVAGGKHRVIITWDNVENNAGYKIEILKSDNTILSSETDYTYDEANHKIIIPDTSVCDDMTKIKVIALSPDKEIYKDSSVAELVIPIGAGGTEIQDGSLAFPWIITKGEQIEAISDPDNIYGYEMDDHYVITRNITVTKPVYSKVVYQSGQTAETTFKGTITGKLNGTDYKPTVTLAIGTDDAPYESDSIAVGFVNYLDGGEISNLNFEGTVNVVFQSELSNLTDRSGVGSVVGFAAKGSKITKCTNNANITGEYLTAGIAGYVNSPTITECVNYGNVTGSNYVGGITAQGASNMTNSHNFGDITGATYVGGICGSANNATITSCSNNGNVKATTDQAGGIVAWSSGNYKLEISKCFNTGDVYIKSGKAAGLFGATYRTQSASYLTQKFAFYDCYNTGKLYNLDGAEVANASLLHTIGRANYSAAYETVRVYSTIPVSVYYSDKGTSLASKFEDIYYTGEWKGAADAVLGAEVTEDELKALLDGNTGFSADIWTMTEEYSYPQITGNLHNKEKEVIPGLKTFEASSSLNGEVYDVAYTWELPENVEKLSIKITNNTDIESATGEENDGWIVLDHETENKNGYTLSGAKADCYYEIFVKLEYSNGTEATEENFEYFIPII